MQTGLRLLFALFVAIASGASSLHGDAVIRVRLKIEPSQTIRAVTIRANGEAHSLAVHDGMVVVPSDFSLPWTISMTRFEPTQYLKVDLDRGAVLVLREYGELRFQLRPPPPKGETVVACLLRSGAGAATEASLIAGDGSFRSPIAAGIYAMAFVGSSRATRIRSGVVIRPGEPTDIGEMSFDSTASVTLRVLDDKSRRPIRGAEFKWSPPDALNAGVAKLLFSHVWSATSDRTGVVKIPSIGPPPVSAQWIVEAPSYTSAASPRVIVAETAAIAAPDTMLRQEAHLLVDVILPHDSNPFKDGRLVLAEPESEAKAVFIPRLQQALRAGQTTLKVDSFGIKRLLLESKEGKALFFQNVDVTRNDQRVVVAPLPCEISGTVRKDGNGVAGSLVTVADRHDAHTILAKTSTTGDGRYEFSVYQTGEVLLYASGKSQPMLKTLNLTGEGELHVDFDLPVAGADIVVVDSETESPVHAQLHGRLTYGSRSRGLLLETDAADHATIDGAPEGRAILYVRAEGYRGQDLTVDLRQDAPSTTVRLQKGGVAAGHVLGADGSPVAGARILGGFASPIAMQYALETSTDESGSFELKNISESGVIAYVIASGYALGVTTLREDEPNTIVLSLPNPGAITLLRGNALPTTLSLILPAPRGSAIIPYRVLHELGASNGMTPFQLLSAGADGRLVLPEFLAAGDYTLFLVTPPQKSSPEQYQKIADLRVPAPAGTVVSIPK